jgi:hypothetical protein
MSLKIAEKINIPCKLQRVKNKNIFINFQIIKRFIGLKRYNILSSDWGSTRPI